MIPQVTNATFIEESALHAIVPNLSADLLHCILHDATTVIPGSVIGFFISGAAIILGVLSILLFSSTKAHSRQHYFLNTYTIVLLLLLAFAETMIFLGSIGCVMAIPWSPGKREVTLTRWARLSYAVDVLVLVMTDGLLVWRCFLVQRVLGRGSSKWCNVFWVFPACLWGMAMATGFVAAVKYPSDQELFTIAFVANIVLNAHATTFITTRLLLHRRTVLACVQDKKLAAQHIYIVGVLLESAAVNLPVAITTAVMIRVGSALNEVMIPIVVASQTLAAILIIHQTALGRVFNQWKGTGISKLVETGECVSSGDVNPPSEILEP